MGKPSRFLYIAIPELLLPAIQSSRDWRIAGSPWFHRHFVPKKLPPWFNRRQRGWFSIPELAMENFSWEHHRSKWGIFRYRV